MVLGTDSIANGINNAGQAVGWGSLAGDVAFHAVVWNGTTPIDLGTLGGANSSAYGIINVGRVVGYADLTGSATSHAAVWNGTAPTDLGTLGGKFSAAYGVNDAGRIVGNSYLAGDVTSHATLWNGTAATDLNSFLDAGTVSAGWVLTYGNQRQRVDHRNGEEQHIRCRSRFCIAAHSLPVSGRRLVSTDAGRKMAIVFDPRKRSL